MSLKIKIGVARCPECKGEVHKDAKLCPECRTRLQEHPEWRQMKANRGSCPALPARFAASLAAAWLTQVS